MPKHIVAVGRLLPVKGRVFESALATMVERRILNT